MKYLLLLLSVILMGVTCVPPAQSQEFDEEGYLVIRAEPELPLALVTLTRSRPVFVSMVITKDISSIPIAYQRTVIAPVKEELKPKK